MKIKPAHIDQIRRGVDGRMVLISADVGGVAEELKRHDPTLRVRFGEAGNPPFWAVYRELDDGRRTELVLTAKAYQGPTGVWLGLDHRIVERVREIDGEGSSGYDLARELERTNQAINHAREQQRQEIVGELGEQAAHALREDLGQRYRGRAFIPRDLD